MTGAAMVEIPEAAMAAADPALGDVHAKLTLLEYGDSARAFSNSAGVRCSKLLSNLPSLGLMLW